LFHIV